MEGFVVFECDLQRSFLFLLREFFTKKEKKIVHNFVVRERCNKPVIKFLKKLGLFPCRQMLVVQKNRI